MNAADYSEWRTTYGQSVTPWTGADGNGDGIVNNSDHVLWRKQMSTAGGPSLGAGSTVPEPSAILLTATAAFFCSLRRKPRAV